MEKIVYSKTKDKSADKTSIDYVKYVPVFYAILIFLGYLNYDFYYRKFDIDIFNYLSINEFLFSFISLSYPVVFILVAYLAYNIYVDLIDKINEDSEQNNQKNNKIKLKLRPEKLFYLNKFTKAKEYYRDSKYLKSIGFFLLYIVCFITYHIITLIPYLILYYGALLIIVPLFSIISLDNSTVKNLVYINTPTRLLIFVIFWYIFFAVFITVKYHNNVINQKKSRFILFSTLLCLIISTLIRYQDIQSNYFIEKNPERKVVFNYKNDIVESDSKKRLLGITADYIFLRNVETKTNYIYKLSDVTNLEISSIHSK